MSSNFQESIAALLATPLDPNEKIPISNQSRTAYAVTIPFHIICWGAVLFRLHTRFRVVREPGWDDYLIMVGVTLNLMALISLLLIFNYGFGLHLATVYQNPVDLIACMKLLWLQHAAYHTCSGFVKLSLLSQYLRMFKDGRVRKVIQALLVCVAIWAIFWFFASWFPCFPVKGFWDRAIVPAPKCWGLGYSSVESAMSFMYAFGGSNMFLDTAIFIIPMTMYFRKGIGKKEILALTALFLLGSVVVLMAIIRLWAITSHRGDGTSRLDFTWWYPLIMILSSIEIDFAIITASVPIFWPVIISSLPQIFVTHEVHITRHERIPEDANGAGDFEMDRPSSPKSNNSQEGLTWKQANSKTDYNDSFVLDHVTGKTQESTRVEIQVQQAKNGKWQH
ncbi:hypothetical protein P280DRAFT_503661 [Massarina eburnea CBS 473.64]|uniref:Rhodopsin domain-containing protein n=1 Tax=Massarina eburnea CBS 473.64 TaxID=1395130 RepID=A0A6A6SCM5_9PLEO|nr:hypothetical protein P280DRAFT_503661 [Massarina eburnea CBS 473.64]